MKSVLDAALSIVAQEGLSALTLRPLAERCAVSVATISHHYGAKDDLIARLIGHVCEAERAFRRRWLDRAHLLADNDLDGRAMLLEQALAAWVSEERERAVFFIELVHARPEQAVIRAALRQWINESAVFWSELAASPRFPWIAYVIDEGAFSLSLEGWDSYRALRGLCIRRLLAGVVRRPSEPAGRAALFTSLVEELSPSVPADAAAARGAGADKRDLIAASTGGLIVEGGADAVTHRAVAAAAGVPASTVVYHFGAREDLVIAGLESVVRDFRLWIGESRKSVGDDAAPLPDELSRTRALVRATATIALASVRSPGLRPAAADMRRRRGENIQVTILLPYGWAGDAAQFDRLAAQVISVCIFGARMLAMALGESEDEAIAAVMTEVARAD